MKQTRLLRTTSLILGLSVLFASCTSETLGPVPSTTLPDSAFLVTHASATLTGVPPEWISTAKKTLTIAYGHTSHGSQLTTGMTGLAAFRGSLYAWNGSGADSALRLRDMPFAGASDLGNPDRSAWATATRTYLGSHPEVNVVLWSWCGQVSTASQGDIELYLALMSSLERDFPAVKFVYMTGHLDGTGPDGNLHQRNEQIRKYCRENGKVLYDFADIESHDPDGNEFLSRMANDNCDYDANGDGSRESNWATLWQNAHPGMWYNCSAAHSQPLNGNLKAYAAWNLWARLAGWPGR
jgi:hypothetical protein